MIDSLWTCWSVDASNNEFREVPLSALVLSTQYWAAIKWSTWGNPGPGPSCCRTNTARNNNKNIGLQVAMQNMDIDIWLRQPPTNKFFLKSFFFATNIMYIYSKSRHCPSSSAPSPSPTHSTYLLFNSICMNDVSQQLLLAIMQNTCCCSLCCCCGFVPGRGWPPAPAWPRPCSWTQDVNGIWIVKDTCWGPFYKSQLLVV